MPPTADWLHFYCGAWSDPLSTAFFKNRLLQLKAITVFNRLMIRSPLHHGSKASAQASITHIFFKFAQN